MGCELNPKIVYVEFTAVVRRQKVNKEKNIGCIVYEIIITENDQPTQLIICPHNALVSHLKLCLRVPGFFMYMFKI